MQKLIILPNGHWVNPDAVERLEVHRDGPVYAYVSQGRGHAASVEKLCLHACDPDEVVELINATRVQTRKETTT